MSSKAFLSQPCRAPPIHRKVAAELHDSNNKVSKWQTSEEACAGHVGGMWICERHLQTMTLKPRFLVTDCQDNITADA